MLIKVIPIESFINSYIVKIYKNMGVNVYKTLDQRPLNSPSSSSKRMKFLMILNISFITLNKRQYFYSGIWKGEGWELHRFMLAFYCIFF